MWQIGTQHTGLVKLALIVGVLGCAGKDVGSRAEGSGSAPTSKGADTVAPLPGSPAPSYASAGMPAGAMPVPTTTADPPSSTVPGLTQEFPPLAEANAEKALLTDCGACHGPDAPPAVSGGINFIGDIDELVFKGLIIPLSSATSPLIRAMQDGSMPPPGSGYLPASADDIGLVTSYVDNIEFWPTP